MEISKGTIYKIINRETTEVVYIGSTNNYKQRKLNHKSTCNNINSNRYNLMIYDIIRSNGGIDNFKFKRIKAYYNILKIDLHKKERKYIAKYKPMGNKVIPTRTDQEYRDHYREKRKQLDQKNKESIKERRKQWYQNNKENIAKRQKLYRDAHKEQMKQYHQLHKDEINKNRRENRVADKTK